jgi:RNA polymerase sigma factor (sigma-70 family)
MIAKPSPNLTILLNRWQEGDEVAFAEALAIVMADLERIAESKMRSEVNATIAPGDLLNEALIRLIQVQKNVQKNEAQKNDDHASADDDDDEDITQSAPGTKNWRSRAHFFANVSLHMRSVLVDRARARNAEKRGSGAIHVTLSSVEYTEESMVTELIALDELLNALKKMDARAAEILHLTYFAGLSREEIAEVLELSITTVDRELRFARAWLSDKLGYEIP